MIIKEKGVILKIGTTVHGDRLLFILTQERGRIQVFDRSFKSGGKKRSTLDLFTYCEFVLYEHNGKYSLNTAEVLENFYKLRENIAGTGLAGYFSQLCLFSTQDTNVQHRQLPSLMLNALYLLSRFPEQAEKVKTVFEWKVAQFLGFTPTLSGCAHVHFDQTVYFSTEDGGLYCKVCLPSGSGAPAFEVQAGEIKAIAHILEHPPSKAFSFKISAPSMKKISEISENFLHYHSGQEFSALSMYKVLGTES